MITKLLDLFLTLKTIITKKVDIRLSSEALNFFCEKYDNWCLVLDSAIEEEEIRILFQKHFIYLKRLGSNLLLSEIAEHANTPLDILIELSNTQNERIFIALSTNSNITPEIISKLIKFNNYSIDEHLLANKSIPEKERHYLLQRQEKGG